jgi:hypothetical protein
MTEEDAPQENEKTETEENREQVEQGAGEDGGDSGPQEILEDPAHNPDDPNLERYRGG